MEAIDLEYMEGASPQAQEGKRKVVERWGGDSIVVRNGFIPVPRTFLSWASTLKPKPLTPAEMLFIITLVGVKWSKRPPRLSYDVLAERTGLSAEYCRKIARSLDRRGLVKRTRLQGDANHFDLSTIFAKIAEHARMDEHARKDEQ